MLITKEFLFYNIHKRVFYCHGQENRYFLGIFFHVKIIGYGKNFLRKERF